MQNNCFEKSSASHHGSVAGIRSDAEIISSIRTILNLHEHEMYAGESQITLAKRISGEDRSAHHSTPTTIVIRDIHKATQSLSRYVKSLADYYVPEIYWMFRHAAAVISEPNATIGYHADNYHVAIVQLAGRKKWVTWPPAVLTNEEVRLLHRERADDPLCRPIMPDANQELETTLAPSSVLFIPALHPHLGITTSEDTSISLSLVWEPPSYIKVLRMLREDHGIDMSLSKAEVSIDYLHQHITTYDTAEDGAKKILAAAGRLNNDLGFNLASIQLSHTANKYVYPNVEIG